MTLGAIRVSALALGASALTLLSPLSVANAATVVHHPAIRGRVTHAHGRHTVHYYAHPYLRGHRYAYGNGYNPGAAAAVGVIGGILGAGLAGAYDCGGYGYGSCDGYGYGYGPDYGGFGYAYPGYGYGYGAGYGGYGGRYGYGGHFRGGAAHFAGGNFGHMGGFGGGHFGGFGGGHMGGVGGGHFGGGGAHFR
ncbi:MAG TPA: hypothetical protein VGG79_19605 [Roseiarcus sp.]|jgi:hypothetical protein